MSELLTTREVAALLRASEDFVRARAADLGGIRLGGGPRAPLRFDPRDVERAQQRWRINREQPARRRRPGRRNGDAWAHEVLPLPEGAR